MNLLNRLISTMNHWSRKLIISVSSGNDSLTHSVESVPQNKESAMCSTLSGTYYSCQLYEISKRNKKISRENKHFNLFFFSLKMKLLLHRKYPTVAQVTAN